MQPSNRSQAFAVATLATLLICANSLPAASSPPETAPANGSNPPASHQSNAGKSGNSNQNSAEPQEAATPRYRPERFAGRAGTYYRLVWGIDDLTVKWTESGDVIRFSYSVLDPEKAKQLNDKKLEPALYAPRAGVQLVVPSMEQVGQLRQSATPEAGKQYWMAFSNKGRLVKKGDYVAVVIGPFRAEGLVVD